MDPNSPEYQRASDASTTGPSPVPQPAPSNQPDLGALLQQLTTVVQQLQEGQERLQQSQGSLRSEMIARYEHLDGRANRARERVEHVREQVGQQTTMLPSLPPGMKMKKLSSIDGKREQELRDWFVRAIAYLKGFQLPEDDPRAVFYVSQFFEGALATWFQGPQARAADEATADFPNVSALRTAALKQFTGRDPADVARDNLRSKKQTWTVAEWANFVRRQLVHLPARDDADNLHTFKSGLKADIAKTLAPQDPKTLAEAIQMAMKIEASNRMIDGRRPQGKPTQVQLHNLQDESDDSSGGQGESDDEGDEDSEDDEALHVVEGFVERSKSEIVKMRKQGRCLRCGARGHIARRCPNRKSTGATSGDQ